MKEKRQSGFHVRLVTKLLISFSMLILIPFLSSSVLLSNMAEKNIRDNSLTYVNLFVKQVSSNIDYFISELDRMTKVIVLDDTLCDYLTSPNDTPAFAYQADQYLNSYMLKLITQQKSIDTMSILGANGRVFTCTSNSVRDLAAFRQQLGLDQATGKGYGLRFAAAHMPDYLFIRPTEPVFSVVRDFFVLDSYVGTLAMNITSSSLIDIINVNPSLLEMDTRILVTNAAGELLADTSPDFTAGKLTAGQTVFRPEEETGGENQCFTSTSGNSGLTTTVMVSKNQLFHSIEVFRSYSLVVTCVLIAISVLLSFSFSFHLVKPIRTLKTATDECAQGNYDIAVPVRTHDEIGALCLSFNEMARRIKGLLNRVYQYRLQTEQAQLKALQNQINPHFLHNTLETIRMKALINKDREVADMIKLLARLFRITLDHKKNVVLLGDELNHVRTYIEVQNMRFNGRFHLSEHIEPGLENCYIIKLTLQPIVENCILHGFANKFDDETIRLEIAQEGEDIVITISDNGKGIEPEHMEGLRKHLQNVDLTFEERKESNSIGMMNIMGRLRLEYGPAYGLDIQPHLPHGTTVVIRIPKNENLQGSL